ncbi:MAG TPA: FlgD immunoglobulin-like domain containing protein [Melioribacteraceae bacterium]|mgnify:CR=1 FL=1|nr:FlgD immunoglobulin-like domain containing protein [Melioribacteraceae bacterium]
MNKKKLILVVVLMFLVSSLSFGQVLRILPYDQDPRSIIAIIRADTTANPGILATRVYELVNGGIYLSTEILTLVKNKTLRIRAPQGEKPIIYLYPTGTGSNPTRPPGNFVVLNGGHIEFTNIAIAGIFEPTPTTLNDVQGGLINTTGVGSRIKIDDCLLTNINGQHIRTGSGTNLIRVTNTIFANMGSLTTSNFGAGKGLDLREVSCDSLILVNNTFANYQDRPVRHLNLAAGNTVTGILNYCIIDHNTFVNGMGFHGVLSLGNVGERVQITNNLFVDAYALGADSLDVTRSVEFNNTGEKFPNGNNSMPWIFTAPNDTTIWRVSNNFYAVSNDGQNWFIANPRHFIGSPLSDHIMTRLGTGAATAFTKLNNFNLVKTPRLMINLMNYYISPTGGNYTKDKPGYNYLIHDMDRKTYKYYTDTLNCTYAIQSPAFTGGQNGFPVGDLNWFPTQKADWENAGGTSVKQLEGMPTEFTLEQNYPNPFNPTTNIRYSLPKAASVTLIIYNTLGQKVAILIDGQDQSAGNYNFTWNGKDMSGNNLSSGIYFYQLKTSDFSVTKKMMLLK